MNKHSFHALGILALIAGIIYWLFIKNNSASADSAQDGTVATTGGYVPPNQRIDQMGVDSSASCGCTGAAAQQTPISSARSFTRFQQRA